MTEEAMEFLEECMDWSVEMALDTLKEKGKRVVISIEDIEEE